MSDNDNNPRVQAINPFGYLEKGKPYYDASWLRVDRWYPADGRDMIPELTFCNGPDDLSDRFIEYGRNVEGNGKYTPDCASCYLGFCHTLDEHNSQLIR